MCNWLRNIFGYRYKAGEILMCRIILNGFEWRDGEISEKEEPLCIIRIIKYHKNKQYLCTILYRFEKNKPVKFNNTKFILEISEDYLRPITFKEKRKYDV